MSKNRRNHSASFKAKVAMEALAGDKTVAELSAKYDVHPTMINAWKRTLREQAATAFEKGPSNAEKDKDALVEELYKQIGQLKVECDFFGRQAQALKREERRAMMETSHSTLSLSRQCRLVGISRPSFYYRPVASDDSEKAAEDQLLMTAIDRHFLEMPYLGSRRMAAILRREGCSVGRQRVRCLMRLMGLQAILPSSSDDGAASRGIGFTPTCCATSPSSGRTRSGVPTSHISRCTAVSCTWWP
jgi:putative transposase